MPAVTTCCFDAPLVGEDDGVFCSTAGDADDGPALDDAGSEEEGAEEVDASADEDEVEDAAADVDIDGIVARLMPDMADEALAPADGEPEPAPALPPETRGVLVCDGSVKAPNPYSIVVPPVVVELVGSVCAEFDQNLGQICTHQPHDCGTHSLAVGSSNREATSPGVVCARSVEF